MNRQLRDRDLFDTIATQYARKDMVMSSAIARKHKLMMSLTPILKCLPDTMTIVDIGCGIGAPARYLTGLYGRYIGIDHSEALVEAARDFHTGNPRATFIATDIKSEAIPHHVADLVFSDGALHHMTELDKVMESLCQVAKPGAFLVVREPHNSNPLISGLRFIRGLIDPAYSWEQIFFSETDLIALFTRHGLSDVSTDYQGFFSTPFAEVILPFQSLMRWLSRCAVVIDRLIEQRMPRSFRKLSFNIIVRGRFPGHPTS